MGDLVSLLWGCPGFSAANSRINHEAVVLCRPSPSPLSLSFRLAHNLHQLSTVQMVCVSECEHSCLQKCTMKSWLLDYFSGFETCVLLTSMTGANQPPPCVIVSLLSNFLFSGRPLAMTRGFSFCDSLQLFALYFLLHMFFECLLLLVGYSAYSGFTC